MVEHKSCKSHTHTFTGNIHGLCRREGISLWRVQVVSEQKLYEHAVVDKVDGAIGCLRFMLDVIRE